ncbi:hypothetical protein ES703_02976 [subsurface metagenome]
MNIIEALHSDNFFKSLFKDIGTWHAWEVYLRALYGLPIEDRKDRKLFKDCTGLRRSPATRIKESFVICGRRSGKSFISSIVAVYIATFKDWSKFLSAGERGYIFIIANDKSQARIVKNYVSGILKSRADLERLITKDLTWEVELKNQVSIMVKTASFRTLRGYTLLAAILEEIAFWRSEESANPDKEILAAVRPSLATIPDSLLIGISTPYSRAGVLYEQFKKHYGKAGGPLIWRAATERMNPTIDKSIIKTAHREDPSAAKAEWDAEFRTDIEAFLPPEFVEAVIIPRRYELPKIAGVKYHAFADPSGGRQDSFTLAIAHKDPNSKKIILDVLREHKPPFQPSVVVSEFSDVLKTYGITQIESDRYAGEWVSEAFRGRGVRVKNSELSASEIYMAFLPLVANGTIELLDNKRLKAQLAGLERKTRSGGKDSITHYPGAHDDLANAAAGASAMIARGPGLIPRIWRIGDRVETSIHDWPDFINLSDENLEKKLEALPEDEMLELYKKLERECGYRIDPENYKRHKIIRNFFLLWNRKKEDDERKKSKGEELVPLSDEEKNRIWSNRGRHGGIAGKTIRISK